VLPSSLVAFRCGGAVANATAFGTATVSTTGGATFSGEISWQVARARCTAKPSKVNFYIDGVLRAPPQAHSSTTAARRKS
jgi:hypothetical protein